MKTKNAIGNLGIYSHKKISCGKGNSPNKEYQTKRYSLNIFNVGSGNKINIVIIFIIY